MQKDHGQMIPEGKKPKKTRNTETVYQNRWYILHFLLKPHINVARIVTAFHWVRVIKTQKLL